MMGPHEIKRLPPPFEFAGWLHLLHEHQRGVKNDFQFPWMAKRAAALWHLLAAVITCTYSRDSFEFESGKFEIINLAEKGVLDKAGYALLSPSEVSRARQSV